MMEYVYIYICRHIYVYIYIYIYIREHAFRDKYYEYISPNTWEGMYSMKYIVRYIIRDIYIYIHIHVYTKPNIAKSEMAEYHIADLGWFGLAWPAFDTWQEPEAVGFEYQRYIYSYKAFGIAWGPKHGTKCR